LFSFTFTLVPLFRRVGPMFFVDETCHDNAAKLEVALLIGITDTHKPVANFYGHDAVINGYTSL